MISRRIFKQTWLIGKMAFHLIIELYFLYKGSTLKTPLSVNKQTKGWWGKGLV